MCAEVTREIRSLTFWSSARARSGLRISQCVSFFSSSISPAGVFNTTRRTCALLRSVSFLSRNSSGFLSMSFLTDWPARNVSFEFWNRTYILPSIAASLPNKISGGRSCPSNFNFSFGLFRPYSASLLLSASISLAGMVPSFCQFSKSDNKVSTNALSAWSLIGVSRRHLLSRRRISIFWSPF